MGCGGELNGFKFSNAGFTSVNPSYAADDVLFDLFHQALRLLGHFGPRLRRLDIVLAWAHDDLPVEQQSYREEERVEEHHHHAEHAREHPATVAGKVG